MSFRKYLEETCDLVSGLFEDRAQDLLRQVEPRRAKRSQRIVNTKNPKRSGTISKILSFVGKKLSVKFFVRDPKGTTREHIGYVYYDKDKDIKQMFCTCEDFYHRAYFRAIEEKRAVFKLLPDVYKKELRKRYKGNYPKEPEPENEIVMCKHITSAIRKYVK